MKFFISVHFKLLCVDNHSKDLLAEINFFGVETLVESDRLAVVYGALPEYMKNRTS